MLQLKSADEGALDKALARDGELCSTIHGSTSRMHSYDMGRRLEVKWHAAFECCVPCTKCQMCLSLRWLRWHPTHHCVHSAERNRQQRAIEPAGNRPWQQIAAMNTHHGAALHWT